ncbi:hypothetical protein BCU91_01855 [Shewanella sp. 10N.286.52.B9]|nr:hypothetical protein BCU91_01855 [Shewanella sp. 10N.286.52.B9]
MNYKQSGKVRDLIATLTNIFYDIFRIQSFMFNQAAQLIIVIITVVIIKSPRGWSLAKRLS